MDINEYTNNLIHEFKIENKEEFKKEFFAYLISLGTSFDPQQKLLEYSNIIFKYMKISKEDFFNKVNSEVEKIKERVNG